MKRKQQSIQDLIESFTLEKDASGNASKTLHNYVDSINLLVKECNISLTDPITKITTSTIRDFQLKMKDKNLSTASINHYLTDIRVFLYWCMNNGYLTQFKINHIKGQDEQIKFFNDDELKKLTEFPGNDCSFITYRTWLINCFILSTGVRVNTLVNIKWDDVNLKELTINLNTLKNKSTSILPISKQLADLLLKYKQTWQTDCDYVFCDRYSQQMTTGAVRLALAKYCKKLGIKRRGPHALRHSFARLYIRNGGSAFTLQQLLTHSDLTMTRRYVKLFSDDLRVDYNLYNPLQNFIQRSSRVTRRLV